MSIDRSLKLKGALARHRNVLTRAERVERLKEEERWAEGDNLLGLPKVANRKVSVGKKKAEAKPTVEGAAGDQAAGAEATATGKTAPAAGGKGAGQAKPAAGGKK